MAYDRSDPRDQQSRWRDERNSGRWEGRDPRGGRGNLDDRGFFDRASDEVASWFGDDEAERRRRADHMRDQRDEARGSGSDRSFDSDRGPERHRERDWNENRGTFARGGSSADDYNRGWKRELSGGGDREQNRVRERDRFG